MSVGGRQSMTGRQSVGARQSVGGRQSVGARQSMTRQSMSGRASMYGSGSRQQTDPRPIKDKAYMKQGMRLVHDFLLDRGYERQISMDTMKNPTSRDFREMLGFLFRQIDGNFEFGGNFEQEVLFCMKLFGYPFTISKMALTAVGSPHTWPHLLAALVWLVEFLTYDEEVEKIKEQGFASGQSSLATLDGEDGEEIFFRYTEKAYANFLDGHDDYATFDEDFQAAFEAKNNLVNEEISRLQGKLKDLELTIGEMKNTEAKVSELETNRVNYVADVEKLKDCIEKLEKHKEGLLKKIESRKLDWQSKQQTMTELRAEKGKLEEELSRQKVTPLEVQEMGHQRAMLKETLRGLDEQKENVKTEIWDLEMKISKKQSAIDKEIKQFNEMALQLELIPAHAKHAKGLNLEVQVNPTQNTASGMVNVDLTKTVKPVLQSLVEFASSSVKQEQQRQREGQDQKDRSLDKKQEQDERVAGLQARLDKLVQKMKTEKERTEKDLQERLANVQAIESQIGLLNAHQKDAVSQSEGEFKQINIAKSQLEIMQNEERKRVTNEIQETCEKVVHHKMQITELLKALASGLKEHRDEL